MYRTAEYVMNGHPDKICDQIADCLLDEYLEKDPYSRVALEVMAGHGKIFISGEVTSKARPDYHKTINKLVKPLGVKNHVQIIKNVVVQSPEISRGVNTGGAGDQGIMVGCATAETPQFLPLEFVYVRKIINELNALSQKIKFIGPDGKAQVTIEGNKPNVVLISVQHKKGIKPIQLRDFLFKKVVKKIFKNTKNIDFISNPSGSFVMGGIEADSGITGRKIVIDQYGPNVEVGGGAFSGKDPTKVDRSAAYMARYIAVWLVKKYKLPEVYVKIAYAIGLKNPLMVSIEPKPSLEGIVRKTFDLTPTGIIKFLDLRKPIYLKTAQFGHYGNKSFTWEKLIRKNI